MRSHRSLLPQAEDVGLHFIDALRSLVAIVTPLQTAHADILDKKVIGFDARYLASGKANNNQPTALCHRAQRSSEEVTSEGVNYDICTDAARGRVDLRT